MSFHEAKTDKIYLFYCVLLAMSILRYQAKSWFEDFVASIKLKLNYFLLMKGDIRRKELEFIARDVQIKSCTTHL